VIVAIDLDQPTFVDARRADASSCHALPAWCGRLAASRRICVLSDDGDALACQGQASA
jgi:hypothetical protein